MPNMHSRIAWICLLLAMSFCVAAAKAPPAQDSSKTDGPTLDATMKFIQEKVTDEGKFNYIFFTTDTRSNNTTQTEVVDEISSLIADPKACELRYNRVLSMDLETVYAGEFNISFHGVKSVQVMTAEAVATEVNAHDGHPNLIVTSTSPLVHEVVIRYSGGKSGYLLFHYHDDADRVAKAIIHAVDLCGGGSSDPF